MTIRRRLIVATGYSRRGIRLENNDKTRISMDMMFRPIATLDCLTRDVNPSSTGYRCDDSTQCAADLVIAVAWRRGDGGVGALHADGRLEFCRFRDSAHNSYVNVRVQHFVNK